MKDSYYFPHDYHARHDPKLELLRMEIGPVGDGIYWDLVEMLYEESGYLPMDNLPLIAKTLNTTTELLQKVIKDAKLFVVKDGNFYSESLLERLKHINAKRRKARISGKFGGLAKAKRTPTERLAIKERKVKESKGKKVKENKTTHLEFVLLTTTEYSTLLAKFGKSNVDRYIDRLNDYVGSKGKRYKSHYYTLNNWLKRDNIKKPEEPKVLTKNEINEFYGKDLKKLVDDTTSKIGKE